MTSACFLSRLNGIRKTLIIDFLSFLFINKQQFVIDIIFEIMAGIIAFVIDYFLEARQ